MIAILLLAASLYEQAVTRLLLEQFPGVEYLLIDVADRRTVLAHWPEPDKPVPVGSLWKPFLVAAAGERAAFDCKPGMCWLAHGHGRINLVDALAHSCNAYFLRHVARFPVAALADTMRAYGLPAPPQNAPETLIGLDGKWTVSPVAMAQAYVHLVASSEPVRNGMKRSAISGTAQRAGIDALAKTGTSACSHESGGHGDGYVVALWPSAEPRYLLMLRLHGTTGAVASGTAGAMLRVIRDGR